jgi:hypothetical protein
MQSSWLTLQDGESVENKARRAGRAVKNAADDAAEGAEHGWFGLKVSLARHFRYCFGEMLTSVPSTLRPPQ